MGLFLAIQQHAAEVFAAEDDQAVVEALNAPTVRQDDGGRDWRYSDFNGKLPAKRIAAVLAKLEGIGDGTVDLPPTYVAAIEAIGMTVDEIRTLARNNLRAILGGSLIISDAGLQSFLRSNGMSEIADLGVWFVSPAQAAIGREVTIEDVAAIREAQAKEQAVLLVQSRLTAIVGWIDALDASQMTIEEINSYVADLFSTFDGNPSTRS